MPENTYATPIVSCTVITLKIHSNLSWILRLVSVNGSILELYTAYESVNYPNHFIRHGGWRLRLNPYSAAPLYKKDASYFEICYY